MAPEEETSKPSRVPDSTDVLWVQLLDQQILKVPEVAPLRVSNCEYLKVTSVSEEGAALLSIGEVSAPAPRRRRICGQMFCEDAVFEVAAEMKPQPPLQIVRDPDLETRGFSAAKPKNIHAGLFCHAPYSRRVNASCSAEPPYY